MTKRKKEILHDAVVRRFADRMRELRVARGMTQAQLAGKAEVSVAYVGRLERGGGAPGVDLVARLALALGTTTSDMLPEEPSPDLRAVLREQARLLFRDVVETQDQALLSLLVQLLNRLSQTASGDD
jgi:transcriptional regulator with XRE-family HTH domain